LKTILEVARLELAYRWEDKWVRAVGPVDFDLIEGEALGLIGESGAGKSTLGLAILGLLGVKGGRCLRGKIATALRPHDIAYVPQDPLAALDPLFTLESLVRETGSGSAEIARAFSRVRLPIEKLKLRSYPHEWSGGMRQRFVIALALLRRPKLIVADEPTSSLDVTLQAEVMRLFRDIQAQGISFLFITHNVPLAAGFVSRLAIMQEGRIVELGATEKIVRNPQSSYTRELLGSIPEFRR
jgi:ABC-type dipeptide/oligopeptide/nickel transport system ATPase component